MNTAEARAIAARHLERVRKLSYEELKRLLEENPVETIEEAGPSGARYCLEVEIHWDGRPDGNIRVIVAIDDGKWRALHPLTGDFIKAPDGSFVGECQSR